jgi:hypothetical protein
MADQPPLVLVLLGPPCAGKSAVLKALLRDARPAPVLHAYERSATAGNAALSFRATEGALRTSGRRVTAVEVTGVHDVAGACSRAELVERFVALHAFVAAAHLLVLVRNGRDRATDGDAANLKVLREALGADAAVPLVAVLTHLDDIEDMDGAARRVAAEHRLPPRALGVSVGVVDAASAPKMRRGLGVELAERCAEAAAALEAFVLDAVAPHPVALPPLAVGTAVVSDVYDAAVDAAASLAAVRAALAAPRPAGAAPRRDTSCVVT